MLCFLQTLKGFLSQQCLENEVLRFFDFFTYMNLPMPACVMFMLMFVNVGEVFSI